MKNLSFAFLAASISLVAADARACRCAIPTTAAVIAGADTIVAGSVIWQHGEGYDTYAAVRFDRVAHLSSRVSEGAAESIRARVAEGEVGFFRGRLSDGRTSCPGVDVRLPLDSRLVYVARLDEHGYLSLEGQTIGHCSSFSTYIGAGSARYEELEAILGSLGRE